MDIKKLEVKIDSRGSLVEAFKLPHDGQVFCVSAKPDEMRGGHYHLRKTESFLVIAGDAEIVVKDRSTGDIMEARVIGERPILITVVPNHTHTITAGEFGTTFIVWADEQYDPEDSDTYMEEI